MPRPTPAGQLYEPPPDSWRWCNLLLWVGLVGLVTSPIVVGGLLWWGLLLAYLIGGPDSKGGPVISGNANQTCDPTLLRT
jgi:hypothetical protein